MVNLKWMSSSLLFFPCTRIHVSSKPSSMLPLSSQVTGTLSYMLGQATFDSSFQEEREQILEGCQSSGDHFRAGLIGLTSGVFGGVTSLITQPYKGAQEYGIGVRKHSAGAEKCVCSSFYTGTEKTFSFLIMGQLCAGVPCSFPPLYLPEYLIK